MKYERPELLKKLLITFAVLCFAASILSVGQDAIREYNRSVALEQSDKAMKASHGATFSNCFWGVDYPRRNRNITLALCFFAFLFCLSPRTIYFAALPYLLAFPLIYQWIAITVRDLSYNQIYMADHPYLLRIASESDWLLFGMIAVTFGVNVLFLSKTAADRWTKRGVA